MIAIVDVGMGNVASIKNMLERLGHEAKLLSAPGVAGASDMYVLPGVGAYDEGVRRLQESGWFDHLATLPTETRILGICLGMQLLGIGSEEGRLGGLARIPVEFVRFREEGLRVPHMGWNTVTPVVDDSLFDPAFEEYRYYFTHSYRAEVRDESTVIAVTEYGSAFPSVLRVGGTRAVQFHPEKSHRFGMSLLGRWVADPC